MFKTKNKYQKELERELEKFANNVNKFSQEKCEIKVKNFGNNEGVSILLNGNSLAILVTLSGVVRKILDESKIPNDFFHILLDGSCVEEKEEE